MADNDDYDDDDGVDIPKPEDPSLDQLCRDLRMEKATRTLPRLAYDAALTPTQRRQFTRDRTASMVVAVPFDDWVEPMVSYLRKNAEAGYVVGRAKLGRSKLGNESDISNLVETLVQGARFIAVSHNPDDYLPAPIAASADIRVSITVPSNKVIAHAIKLATAKRVPKLPNGIAEGLGFTEIVTAIRMGSTPRQCINRLLEARRKRYRGKANLTGIPGVEDLHGYGAARDWAMDLLFDLKLWHAGEIDFDAMERHAVLASEPGLGKTTFARSLAKSAGLPLITTSVAEWFSDSSGYLDGIIKQIDEVFLAATTQAPAILFLDEIDALPDRRDLEGRGRDWWTPIINHMLAKLDGAVSGDIGKLIIVGATNHADRLDPALVRPGRLSRIIRIGLPDAKDLAGIFRQHLGDELKGVDLALLAELAWGSTGADVMGIVKTARRVARQAGRPMHLDDLMYLVAPPDPRSPAALRRTAIHEAAHAVIAFAQGLDDVHAVSIIGRGRLGGYTIRTANSQSMQSRSDIEASIRVDLAGRSAEIVFFGDASTGAGGHPHSDLGTATHALAMIHGAFGLGDDLAFRFGSDRAQDALAVDPFLRRTVNDHLKQLQAETIVLVEQNRERIDKVANALIEHRYLDAQAFRDLMHARRPRPKQPRKPAGGING